MLASKNHLYEAPCLGIEVSTFDAQNACRSKKEREKNEFKRAAVGIGEVQC